MKEFVQWEYLVQFKTIKLFLFKNYKYLEHQMSKYAPTQPSVKK